MKLLLALLSCLLAWSVQAQDLGLSERLQREALAYAETQAGGLPGSYAIRVLRPPALPRLPAGQVRLEPTHASKRDFLGAFFVAFRVFVNEAPAGSARVDLEGKWVGTLLRARTALARNAVPTDDQLETVPFEGVPPAGALTEWPSGFQLKAPVAAGRVLCHADLRPIPLINIGDPVKLRLICGSLEVSADTVARTAGCAGERIRLELPTTRRCIQAEIAGPGEARILWGGPQG